MQMPKLSTTAHSARRWQGKRCELNYRARSRKHSPRAVPGHPVWVSRVGTGGGAAARHGAHGGFLPLSRRSLMFLCCRRLEQLADFFKGLDSLVPVQVIEVPKFSPDEIPQRSVDLAPQMAEQLVEVPTVLSPSLLQQRSAEQTIDIPVPRRGGSGSGDPQGFLSRQDVWCRVNR